MEENPVSGKPDLKLLETITCDGSPDLENYDPCESNEDITETDLAILLKQEAAKLLEQRKKADKTQEPIFTKEEEAKLQEIKAIAQRKLEAIAQQQEESGKPQTPQKYVEGSLASYERDSKDQEPKYLKEKFETNIQRDKEIQEQGDTEEEKQDTIYQTESEEPVKEESDFLEAQKEEQSKETDITKEQSTETVSDVVYEKRTESSKIDAGVWPDSTSYHSFHDSEESEEEKYQPEGRRTKKRVCKKVIKNPFFTNRLHFQNQQLCPPPRTPPQQKLPPVQEVDSVGSIVCHKGDKKKRLRKKRENTLSVTSAITVKKPKPIFKTPTEKKTTSIEQKRDKEESDRKTPKKVEVKEETKIGSKATEDAESEQKDTSGEKADEKIKKREKKKKESITRGQSEEVRFKRSEHFEKPEKEASKAGGLSEKAESRVIYDEKTADEKVETKPESHIDKEIQYNFEMGNSTEEKPAAEEVSEDKMSLKFENASPKEEEEQEVAGDSVSKESEQPTVARMESVEEKSAAETTKETSRKESGAPSRRKHCERRERLPCRKKVSDVSITFLPPQIPPLQRDLPPTCPRNIPEFQRQLHMAGKGKMCKKRLDKSKTK